MSHVSCGALINTRKDPEKCLCKYGEIKDRHGGAGFDKNGQFVQQHLRGPDVTLFRGKCKVFISPQLEGPELYLE